MADSDVTTVASGVTRVDCWWGYILKGCRDDLTAAGFAKPEWLADGIARNTRGKVIRKVAYEVNGRKAQSRMLPGRGRYELHVEYTQRELDRKELEDALAKERNQIERLPASREAFMAQMTEALARWMYMSETVLMQHLGGYRFNGNVHEILIEATSDIAAALRALPVSFSQAARDREIQQIRSKTAQCDKGLQSLLLTVQSESIAEEQS